MQDPVVERYWAWLRANHPDAISSFVPNGGTLGAVAPEMAHAIAVYTAHDGQATEDGLPPGVYDGFRWMTLAEITKTREDLDGMATVGEWDDDNWKRIHWWVPGWLPVLTDDNSNYLCIDTVGTFTGKPGQLIEFLHDDAARAVIAPSFDAWFAAWVESLEAGTWKVDPDDGIERTPATDRQFADRLPGFPIAHASTKEKKPKTKTAPAKRRKKPTPEEIALLGIYTQRMSKDEITAAIAAGAKLDARDTQGNTPLHLAMACGNEIPAQTLIAAGADVNAGDHTGGTPTHSAMYAHARVVPHLIDALAVAGADLARADQAGLAPIFYAATAEAVQALIAHGVDPKRLGPDGESLSAHVARRGAYPAVVELLKSLGA